VSTSTVADELREAVCAANLRLPAEGLVTLTWGNVSGRSPNGDLIAIKPSGVPYTEMRPEHMVILTLDGEVVEGELRPSTDTPTHLELYRAFPEIRGIVHAHSAYATAFAQARRPLPCLGTTHADHFAGAVPVTRPLTAAEVSGSYELATAIPGVLVAGHAPFTWGATPSKAVDNAVALEAVAHMALLSAQIANPAPLEPYVLAAHHERKHGRHAYYGQPVEAAEA
jgi:L-ribulose-5-phosphate 4-epimerase